MVQVGYPLRVKNLNKSFTRVSQPHTHRNLSCRTTRFTVTATRVRFTTTLTGKSSGQRSLRGTLVRVSFWLQVQSATGHLPLTTNTQPRRERMRFSSPRRSPSPSSQKSNYFFETFQHVFIFQVCSGRRERLKRQGTDIQTQLQCIRWCVSS